MTDAPSETLPEPGYLAKRIGRLARRLHKSMQTTKEYADFVVAYEVMQKKFNILWDHEREASRGIVVPRKKFKDWRHAELYDFGRKELGMRNLKMRIARKAMLLKVGDELLKLHPDAEDADAAIEAHGLYSSKPRYPAESELMDIELAGREKAIELVSDNRPLIASENLPLDTADDPIATNRWLMGFEQVAEETGGQ